MMYQIVWRGESIGFVAKEKYKREIACLEPFLEAAPQVWAWSWSLVKWSWMSKITFHFQVLVKTAILAQRKLTGDDIVLRDLDDGLWIGYIVSIVGTGNIT